jgi:hypothetical protein
MPTEKEFSQNLPTNIIRQKVQNKSASSAVVLFQLTLSLLHENSQPGLTEENGHIRLSCWTMFESLTQTRLMGLGAPKCCQICNPTPTLTDSGAETECLRSRKLRRLHLFCNGIEQAREAAACAKGYTDHKLQAVGHKRTKSRNGRGPL